MNFKQLIADEDAVSPVIGVILMVAITVILAAVIGTFVLGLGENVQDSAPQANFQFEYTSTGGNGFTGTDGDEVAVTHTGGEDIEDNNLAIQVQGTEVTTSNGLTKSIGGDGTWSTGDSATYEDSSAPDLASGNTVRVVWTSASGGTSNTIGQSTVPS